MIISDTATSEKHIIRENNEITPILEVRGLKTYFNLFGGTVKAVDGVDFSVYMGKTLGIVGESGCGKSVTAKSIMQIVPSPPGELIGGEIIYHKNGEQVDIAKLKPDSLRMRSLRGSEIAYIFQEPMTALSPIHTIGNQISETIRLHQGLVKKEAWEKSIDILKKVKIPRPEMVVHNYIHQLSGGMRQRAMIAQALSCEPSILIADEPTTALDVTMQAQILKLMKDLQQETGMAMILITHDMGVIAQTADYVLVEYLGKVMESGTVFQIFDDPLHPYTKGLFNSIPRIDQDTPPRSIRGSVPDPFSAREGCPFANRCDCKLDRCTPDQVPPLVDIGDRHMVRCYLYDTNGDIHE